jgi:hypothetical protein
LSELECVECVECVECTLNVLSDFNSFLNQNKLMLEKFSILIGKWKGKGTACFPTIETTDYIEELDFELTGDGESIMFIQRDLAF